MDNRETLRQCIYGSQALPLSIAESSYDPSIDNIGSPTITNPIWDPTIAMLEPHHMVRVNFPALNALNKDEQPILRTPWNAAARYQPLPLIDDRHVQRNTGRDFRGQNGFQSMCRASLERPAEGLHLAGELCKDMRELSKYMAVTHLGALLFRTDKDPTPMIRICRRTDFRRIGGVRADPRQDYNMPFRDFLTIENDARWFQDIFHLIEMRDDRAARFVQSRLVDHIEAHGAGHVSELYEKFCLSFKPRRQPYYEQYIFKDSMLAPKRTVSANLLRPQKCMLCKKPMNNTSHIAVVFPCHPEHVAGRSCLLDLCHRSKPDDVKCMKCDARLFNDQVLEHLKFGICNGEYRHDPHYSQYENFERSCLDLDLELPFRMNEDFTFAVDPQLFMEIWNRMVYSSSLELSRPHIEFINAPEFEIVEAVLRTHLNRLHGVITSIPALDGWLNLMVFQAFEVPFKRTGQDRYIRDDTPPHIMKDFFFRPGFAQCVERALNRTLRFLQLRTCSCKGQEELHSHGGREYDNPDLLFSEWTPQRSEVYFWQRSPDGEKYLAEFRAKPHGADRGIVGVL